MRTGVPIVIIDHYFTQDIDALSLQSEQLGINLIRIPYINLFRIAEHYFGPDIRDGSYYAEIMTICKERYRSLLIKLFKVIKPERRIKALLMPSDSFFWIREIISLLRERQIPCIVVDKEGTISPHSMVQHSRQIATYYPFMSDAIIVWSERQKVFWLRTGVSESRIFVEGQPRSDYFFDPKRWLSRNELPAKTEHFVLFFTFDTDAYAPNPGVPLWRGLREDIHKSLIRFAINYPDITFIVKTHPQQSDAFEVEKEFNRTGLKNILVLHGPELSRLLIVYADVIIGFQTTALIEAMLLDKGVIYTKWTDDVANNLDKLIPFHSAGGIQIASSLDEFESFLHGFLKSGIVKIPQDVLKLRRAFVDIYLHNPDGRASIRVLKRINALIS